ncbi:MAG TPA: nitroreductase family protein [Spirochaetota bacterium]|nr:nitroreductase family protein [Spirochaetota bacterium]
MKFNRSVQELVAVRSSCRTFSGEPIPDEKLRALVVILDSLPVPPFAGSARFRLVEMKGKDGAATRRPGTYGVIRGARWFIVGAIANTPRSMEDFGFLMEAIILGATDLGLATCWLGGTFNRTDYARLVEARSTETVPAISPVGYPAARRALTDSIIRWSAGSKRRKAAGELFFMYDFNQPIVDLSGNDHAPALESVQRAPSASNLQPWRLVLDDTSGAVHFYMTRSRGYDKLIRAVDLQRIDMGIAMCHFQLCSSENGTPGRWSVSDPVLKNVPEKTEYIASWTQE